MSGLFGGGSPHAPPPAPPPPTAADPAAQLAAQNAAANAAKAQGQGSTILTSGMGIAAQPPTQKRTLLGS